LNKKSAQKQKRPKETTASRKPLFHEKSNFKHSSKTAKTKPKTSPLARRAGFTFGATCHKKVPCPQARKAS
jgi:hypothetical protein